MDVLEITETLLQQVPALGVLVVVVYLFLQALSKTADRVKEVSVSFQSQIDNWNEYHKEAAKACHDIQDRAIEAIVKNSTVLQELRDDIRNNHRSKGV